MFKRCQLLWWHLSRQHMPWWHLSKLAISQLLLVRFWSLKNLGLNKNLGSENKFGVWKQIWGLITNLGSENKFGSKKLWVKRNVRSKKTIGKHCLYARNRFLVCFVIVDFGGVLLVLLVTRVIQTPNSINSAKSQWVVYVSNFSLLALPLLIDFCGGYCSSSCCCSCCSCDRGKTKSTLSL